MSNQYIDLPVSGGGGSGSVNSVSATSPLSSTGGTNPVISLPQASATQSGYLAQADWITFNAKQSALTIGNFTDSSAGADGITVTGGTGAVIGSGVTINQAKAGTSQNGYLSSTDWNTFNNKQAAGLPTFTQTVYVSVQGNDTSGTGSIVAPYASITKAMASITDATTTKRYQILVNPGQYSENTGTFLWKAWVWIVGIGYDVTQWRITASSGTPMITLDPTTWGTSASSTNGAYKIGLLNMTLYGGMQLNLNTQTAFATNTGSSQGCNAIIYLDNVYNQSTMPTTLTGNAIQNGQVSASTAYYVLSSIFTSAVTIDSVVTQTYIDNTIMRTSLSYTTTYNSNNITQTQVTIEGPLSISNAANFASTYFLVGSPVSTTFTATGSGSVATTITSDGISLSKAANLSIAGTVTLNRNTDVTGLAFTPTTSANWSSVPTTTQQAIDTLASETQGLNLGITATTVSGSTSGTAQFSQSVASPYFKKVMIYCATLTGTASYTFPTAFSFTPVVVTTSGLSSSLVTTLNTTSITVTGASSTGFLTIEGY